MSAQALLVFLPALLNGFLLTNLLLPSRRWEILVCKAFLGIGAGLGLTSCFYFLWLFIFPLGNYFPAFQIVLLLALFALNVAFRNSKAIAIPIPERRLNWTSLLLAGMAVLALGIYFYGLSRLALMNTHGDYDAQAVWNLRARFIYRTGADWLVSFSPDLYWKFHTDYPLLLPLNTVWAWRMLGGEVMRAPAVQAVLFAGGLVGLMFSWVYLARGLGSACLAVSILAVTPLAVKLGFFQTADAPLTCFLLAALLLVFLYTQTKAGSLPGLAGLMTGLAAWTKNEGLLFVFIMLGLAVFFSLLRRLPGRHLLAFLAGLAFPLAVTGFFKLAIAPSNDLFAPADLLARFLDPGRYLTILRMLASGILSFGEWPFSVVLVLLVYTVLMYSRPRQGERSGILLTALLLALQLLGYLAVYLFTPHPLEWHMTYSLERLLFHFFPGLLFVVLMLTHPPEQIPEKAQYVTHH